MEHVTSTEADTSKRLGVFWRLVEALTVLAFVSMLAVMFIQVAARYAIGTAVPWTDETSRFLFIASIFLGAAICQRNSEHIRITVVLDALSPRLRRWFETVAAVFSALVAIALVVGAVQMAMGSTHLKAATLPISYSWLYVVQAIGLVLVLLLFLRQLWRDFGPSAEGKDLK